MKIGPRVAGAAMIALGGLSSGCDRRPKAQRAPSVNAGAASGGKCVVHLHGKSGAGGPASVSGGVTHVRPDGNAPGWGGRQWLYFPESEYGEVRATIASAIAGAGCSRVIVHGFSNGAAAAGKLLCRGERFDGTVVGYVLDDPVPDHGVEPCAPPPDVKVRVYWTGGLGQAVAGWSCASADWTCEGGTSLGIEKYVHALGTTVTRSVHTSHVEYDSPPEYTAWW